DLRSFMLNFEINAFIYDEDVISIMNKDFFEDINNSEELTGEDFDGRNIIKKAKESIARLFSPIL
ncbi:MAG: cardiolipin synthase, partial [Peptostreptococcaceae bacterium]